MAAAGMAMVVGIWLTFLENLRGGDATRILIWAGPYLGLPLVAQIGSEYPKRGHGASKRGDEPQTGQGKPRLLYTH